MTTLAEHYLRVELALFAHHACSECDQDQTLAALLKALRERDEAMRNEAPL